MYYVLRERLRTKDEGLKVKEEMKIKILQAGFRHSPQGHFVASLGRAGMTGFLYRGGGAAPTGCEKKKGKRKV